MNALLPALLIAATVGLSRRADAQPLQRMRVCLNGAWQMVSADDLPEEPPTDGWRTVRVSGLFRSHAPHEFSEEPPSSHTDGQPKSAWYRLDFPIPRDWDDGRRIELYLKGINYRGRVFLNGRQIGKCAGPHLPLRLDITQHAKAAQQNRLEVRVDACGAGDKIGREGAYAGTWRDVFLETRPATHIADVFVIPSVRQRALTVCSAVSNGRDVARPPCWGRANRSRWRCTPRACIRASCAWP